MECPTDLRWLTMAIASLPPWLGYALADLATGLHWLAFPNRRHAALANLAVILPRASRRDRAQVARRMMRSYNRMMYEFFRLRTCPRGAAASSRSSEEHWTTASHAAAA